MADHDNPSPARKPGRPTEPSPVPVRLDETRTDVLRTVGKKTGDKRSRSKQRGPLGGERA